MPSSYDNEIPQPEENDTDSLALALRLLAIDDLGEPQEDPPQLFVGRLPDEMDEDVPVPEGLTLVGSMVSSGWRGEPGTEIVLDAALSAEGVREVYRQRMVAAGWFEREWPGPRGGFGGGPRHGRLVMCKSERGPSLMVTANDRQEEPTAVRLILDTSCRNSPCIPHRHYGRDFERNVIPELEPPPGARYVERGWGSSRGDDIQESRATIEAETDLEGVAVHYVGQLAAGGWNRTGGGVSGPLASSAWELTDEEGQVWMGVFTALEVPQHTPGRCILQVRASLISEGEYYHSDESPITSYVEKFLQGKNVDARERVGLFRLAWDMTMSGFGARQAMYERFFFGDPVRMRPLLYRNYNKEPSKEKIQDFLKRTSEVDPAEQLGAEA